MDLSERTNVEISGLEAEAREFIAHCREKGLVLAAMGYSVVTVHPRGGLTDDERDQLIKIKPVVYALLKLEVALLLGRFSPDGYVYVIKAGPYFKIGRSTQVDKRIKVLQTQMPFKMELIHVIQCERHALTEQFWHERFADVRVNGEWFALRQVHLEEITDVRFMRGRDRW